MSQEPSSLLGYGPIQSDPWLRAAENIPPRLKRTRCWLKSAFDCHSEAYYCNLDAHKERLRCSCKSASPGVSEFVTQWTKPPENFHSATFRVTQSLVP